MRRLAAIAVAAAIAGCSRADSAADSSSIAQAGNSDAPRVVTVRAHDFAYATSDTIPAGMTTFRLVNEGPNLHHLVLARLDSGKTVPDLVAAFQNPGPPPKWLVPIGGPNAPDVNAEANATLDVPPGNYALICFVDMPGGVPHFAKGMVKGLTVIPSSGASAPEPIATDSITLDDYSFKLSRPLVAGRHTFRVVSNAVQEHELELIKLAPGKTPQDLLAWIQNPNGPPPGSAIGGTTPAQKGMPVWFDADITPGDYLLICFVLAPDGKPHFAHGMMLTQTVD